MNYRSIITNSSQETQKLAQQIAKRNHAKLICLYGELGAGKTTFVKGFAKALGISTKIQSPTFTYQRIHRGLRNTLFHFDCYRLTKPDEALLCEIYEALECKNGIVVIEWADRIKKLLPTPRLDIFFEYKDFSARKIILMPNS